MIGRRICASKKPYLIDSMLYARAVAINAHGQLGSVGRTSVLHERRSPVQSYEYYTVVCTVSVVPLGTLETLVLGLRL